VDGHIPAPGEEHPQAIFRIVSPGFFATLGLPIIEGRDFNEGDRGGSEPVAVVSMSVAQKMFPKGSPVNHQVIWTDPILKAVPMVSTEPLRIIGVVADMDDVNLVPKPTMTVYRPFDQEAGLGAGNLFVHTRSDPYGLVTPITQIMRRMSPNQPVERAATLDDVRAEVLSPERLNVVVSAVFAGVALLIAVVGVAGVLAFSVSGRTREFGIRLAIGSEPRHLLKGVLADGVIIAVAGVAAGGACGWVLMQWAVSYFPDMRRPDVLPVAASAVVLLAAAVVASVLPAARAARVDVIQALRAD
jgi:ABC-type antimicrobial peptide transport system permease subunit